MTPPRNRRRLASPRVESENHGEAGFVLASRDAQVDWVFEILFGKGALDRDDAVGQVLFWLFAASRGGLHRPSGSAVRATVVAALGGFLCYYVGTVADFYARR